MIRIEAHHLFNYVCDFWILGIVKICHDILPIFSENLYFKGYGRKQLRKNVASSNHIFCA